MEPFQSGFKARHSTETALLEVSNDLLLPLDTGENAILVLLDLSAAFDTVDHPTLLSRLHQWVGIRGSALQCFSSYLSHRSFSVSICQHSSSSAPLYCGVHPGSNRVLFIYAPTGEYNKKIQPVVPLYAAVHNYISL